MFIAAKNDMNESMDSIYSSQSISTNAEKKIASINCPTCREENWQSPDSLPINRFAQQEARKQSTKYVSKKKKESKKCKIH